MTANNSGKLNIGEVDAIKSITSITPSERTPRQSAYLAACLAALAHQPSRWYSYQDWGTGGPIMFLAERGIGFSPVSGTRPMARSWYDGASATKHIGVRRNGE